MQDICLLIYGFRSPNFGDVWEGSGKPWKPSSVEYSEYSDFLKIFLFQLYAKIDEWRPMAKWELRAATKRTGNSDVSPSTYLQSVSYAITLD